MRRISVHDHTRLQQQGQANKPTVPTSEQVSSQQATSLPANKSSCLQANRCQANQPTSQPAKMPTRRHANKPTSQHANMPTSSHTQPANKEHRANKPTSRNMQHHHHQELELQIWGRVLLSTWPEALGMVIVCTRTSRFHRLAHYCLLCNHKPPSGQLPTHIQAANSIMFCRSMDGQHSRVLKSGLIANIGISCSSAESSILSSCGCYGGRTFGFGEGLQ
jgi:hypothetical protein